MIYKGEKMETKEIREIIKERLQQEETQQDKQYYLNELFKDLKEIEQEINNM